MSYHLHNCRLVYKHTWLLFHHYTWKQKILKTLWEMGEWRRCRYWWSLISMSSGGDRGRKYFSVFSCFFFSFFLVLSPIKRGACPAEGSLYLGFFMLLTLYTAWGQAISIFSASASHSPVKCSHMALGAAEGGFLSPGSPLLPARIPRECWGTAAVSQEEGGVRDHQSSQVSICSLCALAGGEGPDVDWLYFLLPRLPLVLKAGAPGLQQELERAFAVAHYLAMSSMTGTWLAQYVTNWALCNFKNRKKLCQICGYRWQSWQLLVLWRPSWCTSLTSCL